jgi:hypothetical protein
VYENKREIKTALQKQKRKVEAIERMLCEEALIKGYERMDYFKTREYKRLCMATHTEWQSLWVNQYGSLKLKKTAERPKVRNYMDSLNEYKPAEVGDMDYYGWMCLRIIETSTLEKRHKTERIVLQETMSKAVYEKYLHAYAQKVKKHEKNREKTREAADKQQIS